MPKKAIAGIAIGVVLLMALCCKVVWIFANQKIKYRLAWRDIIESKHLGADDKSDIHFKPELHTPPVLQVKGAIDPKIDANTLGTIALDQAFNFIALFVVTNRRSQHALHHVSIAEEINNGHDCRHRDGRSIYCAAVQC